MKKNIIDEAIHSKNYPSVLHIFGEEDFLVEEAYHKITNDILYESGVQYDFDLFDAADSDKAIKDNRSVIDICNSYPFVSEKRLVVIKNFDKMFPTRLTKRNDAAILFSKYFENPHPTTNLILISNLEDFFGISNELNNSKKHEKALKKMESARAPFNILFQKHPWIEFPKIYENQLRGWIKERIESLNKIINDDACELLIAQTMPTLRAIHNEIEKLVIYLSDKKEITIDDVAFVSGATRQFNVFELQKEIGKRSADNALKIIQNILSNDSQEMLIITVLLRYFVSLWKLSEEINHKYNDYQLASKIGVNPYFINEYKEAAKNYNHNQIQNAFSALLEADIELKTSSVDRILTMQKMVIKIINHK